MARGTIRVYPFTLTGDVVSSEQLYAERVLDRLRDQEVTVVDSRRTADVVHAFEINPLVAEALRPRRLVELWRCLRSRTPVVVSWDDLYFTGQPDLTENPGLYGLNSALQRRVLERADAVIAFSESVRESMRTAVDHDAIHVVHHGVDDAYRVASPDHEGFGLPLVEAMAAGTPVVASDVYAVPEVVGNAGALLPPDDVSGHVEAIRRLLTDHKHWRTYYDRAVERSRQFSWDDTARRTRRVYASVLEPGTGAVRESGVP